MAAKELPLVTKCPATLWTSIIKVLVMHETGDGIGPLLLMGTVVEVATELSDRFLGGELTINTTDTPRSIFKKFAESIEDDEHVEVFFL